MSDTKDAAGNPNKGKRLIAKLLLGAALAGSGGAAAFALMTTGFIGASAEAKENGPQLVRKGASDPYIFADPVSVQSPARIVHGDGGSRYRTAYYTFAEAFTSNLKDSGALVQLSLAASTQRDGRVLMWLDQHELAIRSRLLVEIADTSAEEIASPEGKAQLQDRLTAAINDVLTGQEGFGGVDAVHFRSFIVQ